MGKKNQSTTVNNINQLNLEIDYDKLAEAIVRAQEKAKQEPVNTDDKKKNCFFVAAWRILKGEKSKDGRYLSAPFAVISSVFFRMLSVLCIIFIPIFIIAGVRTLKDAIWSGFEAITVNVSGMVLLIALILALLVYALLFWGAANDVYYEKDRNYVIGVFSGIISLTALVVSIIALFKN